MSSINDMLKDSDKYWLAELAKTQPLAAIYFRDRLTEIEVLSKLQVLAEAKRRCTNYHLSRDCLTEIATMQLEVGRNKRVARKKCCTGPHC